LWAAVLTHIRAALVDGRIVGLKNVGTLEPYMRAARTVFVPYSRTYIERSAHRHVRFVPSRNLRDDLKASKD
jgi:nucleoid DNA-binding protein